FGTTLCAAAGPRRPQGRMLRRGSQVWRHQSNLGGCLGRRRASPSPGGRHRCGARQCRGGGHRDALQAPLEAGATSPELPSTRGAEVRLGAATCAPVAFVCQRREGGPTASLELGEAKPWRPSTPEGGGEADELRGSREKSGASPRTPWRAFESAACPPPLCCRGRLGDYRAPGSSCPCLQAEDRRRHLQNTFCPFPGACILNGQHRIPRPSAAAAAVASVLLG
ncbi:unnamed protein product, partial [Symbiodinium necroappetens]